MVFEELLTRWTCSFDGKGLFILYSVIKVDSFTRMLWSIYTKVKDEGLVQVCQCRCKKVNT